jgi:hypothetical protein
MRFRDETNLSSLEVDSRCKRQSGYSPLMIKEPRFIPSREANILKVAGSIGIRTPHTFVIRVTSDFTIG